VGEHLLDVQRVGGSNPSNFTIFGTWRSLVARLDGVQEVASSNLVVPTIRVGL
jgi:hypothetical protein